MNPRRILSTALRVLRQLRHDPRTIAMMLFVPALLLTLLRYVSDGNPASFNRLAPLMLGIFPFIIMFLVTSIATLRERSSGTLERLMTLPLGTFEFIAGYAIAFAAMTAAQAALAIFVTVRLLDVAVAGGETRLFFVALAAGLLGEALGLCVSAFAASEFQAVQFMPAAVFPQLLVCGLLVPREAMAVALQRLSDIMPMTYAADAAARVTAESVWSKGLTSDFIVMGGFFVAALALGSVTLRRK